MRVGVFAENSHLTGVGRPESGGGQSLETEILRALADSSGDRGHTFAVFGKWPDGRPPTSEAAHVSFVDTQVGFAKRARCAAARAVQALDRALWRPWAWYANTDPIGAVVRAAGVDVLWYLTPTFEPLDLPFLYTVWDLQHRLQPWFPEVSRNGQWRNHDRRCAGVLPRASAIITGTEVGGRDVARLYGVPAERIYKVPFPTPTMPDVSDEDVRGVLERHRLESGRFLFYPAQFWPHKNHVGLLAALRHLRESHGLELPLVLTGSDKGNRAHIEALAQELGLQDLVRFAGFVSREELAALYAHATALVMPTFFGPDNLPPLEAFAMGCPVVASDVPGHREQLGDAALLVDPLEPEAMALAVKSIHDNDDLRRALIEKGRARAAAWTARDYVQKVIDIIDSFEPYLSSWPRH